MNKLLSCFRVRDTSSFHPARVAGHAQGLPRVRTSFSVMRAVDTPKHSALRRTTKLSDATTSPIIVERMHAPLALPDSAKSCGSGVSSTSGALPQTKLVQHVT
jgi:hypothetical protein